MPSEVIAVLGTLSGALLVGVINYFSNKSVKNQEWRLSLAREQAATKQRLYSEFLVEVQRLVIQSFEEKISSLSGLHAMHGKFAEISLIASSVVIDAARKLSDYVLNCHSMQPAEAKNGFFALKEAFIVAARNDIKEVLNGA